MFLGRLISDETIGDCRIVKEAVAKLGVLRAGANQNAEHARVERPRAEALREGGAEKEVGRPGARLEFGFEQFALRIEAVGCAGWQFDAEQKRGLGLRRLAVDEAVLAEHGDVAETGGVPAIIYRVADEAARQMLVVPFADVGA